MAYVADAIEIITDSGLGVPVTYSNTAIGLASDGHFYLITDRFSIASGDGKIITGDTTRATWYEKILSRESGFGFSKRCDFVDSGAMESLSAFSFSICNTDAFWSTMKTNSVYLARCRVKYYRVTSSDLITFNFELRWSGVIDEQPYGETTQTIQCVDNSKEIYKTLPTKTVTKTLFENAPSDSIDKNIPVVVGRVAYSPMINVTGKGARAQLCYINGEAKYVAAATYYSVGVVPVYAPYIQLYTSGMTFSDSDTRLTGKYLHAVVGGESQYRRINGCDNTSSNLTYVYLDEAITGITGSNLWTTIGNTSDDIWYFEVVDLSPTFLLSNNPIYEIKELNDSSYLYSYSDGVYENVPELKNETSLTNISLTGYPGIAITSALDDTDTASILFPISPSGITKISESGWTTSALPAANVSCPNLFDKSDSTGYLLQKTLVSGGASMSAVFDLTLPDQSTLKQYDKFYILADMKHSLLSGATATVAIAISVQTIDIYGRVVTTDVSLESVFSGTATGAEEYIFLLPRLYYGPPDGEVTRFDNYKAALDLAPILSGSKATNAYNKIRVTIGVSIIATSVNYGLNINEIGLIGERAISVNNESIFTSVVGEKFGSQWDSSRTEDKSPTDPVLLIGDAYEHLIRNYDYYAPTWASSTSYVIGDKIKSTGDNGNIFVCTVAGTSHASVEPTWTTTEGATYTDGTVTWTQLKRIPIHTGTFDTLKVQRGDWFIGRALTEKKESIEYCRELCRHGFFISMIDKNGLIKVKSWLDNVTPTVTFNTTNIIQWSIGNAVYTPMRRVYNDYTVRYDYNPGADNYNKTLFVTNVDKPAFPSSTLYSDPGTAVPFTGIVCDPGDEPGQYYLTITTTSPHGLSGNVSLKLTGNTHGYDFTGTGWTTGTSTIMILLSITPSALSSTTGTLYKYSSTALKWKTYVGGISNYATAKALWDDCHASFLITKTVSKCPDELSNCPWFIDPYAEDPDGNYIFRTGDDLDLDVGDDHPAVYYLQKLVSWSSWQKKQISFDVPDVSTYSALEIGDPVYFLDAKRTNGETLLGWIHEIEFIPKSGNEIEKIKFGLTLLQDGYTPDGLIIDEVGATDIIDELGASDIYEESGA